ncbi:MAG: protein PhnA [Verrucomicrobiales bacterium]|jgi:protein PhnA
MSKGYEENQERLRLLSLLGKPLARRSKRRCELCESTGNELRPYEIPPAPKEPAIENTLLLCSACMEQLKAPRKMDPARWRPLESAIWSSEAAVQIVAARLLRRMKDIPWAMEALEAVGLDEEIEARIAEKS